MTPSIYEEVKAIVKAAKDETSAAIAAEKFCGANGVEFHPLACDLVVKQFAKEPAKASCGHLPGATREAREKAFAKLSEAPAEAPARKKRKAAEPSE